MGTRRDRVAPGQGREYQRVRILSAMVSAASTRGTEAVTVSDILALARVSRNAFYELFSGCEDCLRATVEEGVSLATIRVAAAHNPRDRWADRVRTAVHVLLRLIDEEPELACLCIGQALLRGATHDRLPRALDQLAGILDQGWREPNACKQSSPLAAEMALGGALSLTHSRLIAGEESLLLSLSGPLMYMIVLPYLGLKAARRELARREPPRSPLRARREPAAGAQPALGVRVTYRTMRALAVIGAQSGLSNSEVAERAEVIDQGQISKLLRRLNRAGLIENTRAGKARGAANAWRLTTEGRELWQTITRAPLHGAP